MRLFLSSPQNFTQLLPSQSLHTEITFLWVAFKIYFEVIVSDSMENWASVSANAALQISLLDARLIVVLSLWTSAIWHASSKDQ